MLITVKDITGLNCGTAEEALLLRDYIKSNMEHDEQIVLDFMDIKSTSSSFFYTCFGSLVKEYGLDILKKKLGFQNLTPKDRYLLNTAVKSAKKIQASEDLPRTL